MRVDPDAREIVPVAVRERGERRDADGALPSEGGDPRRIVSMDDLQGARELLDDHRLGLDPVARLCALVAHRDRRGGGGTVVGRQFASRIAEPTA